MTWHESWTKDTDPTMGGQGGHDAISIAAVDQDVVAAAQEASVKWHHADQSVATRVVLVQRVGAALPRRRAWVHVQILPNRAAARQTAGSV